MIGPLERILQLRRMPGFAALPLEALAALADMLRERQFAKGAVVQREGEPVNRIQLILDGTVATSRNGLSLTPGGPGTPLGALLVLARDSHGFTGIAETETFSLELDSEALLEVCEDHFVIVHEVLRYLAGSLVDVEQRIGPQRRLQQPFTRLAQGELDLVERIFFLRQMAPFARSSISALSELSRGLTEVQFQPGTALWAEGDPAHYVLLVVEGHVTCVSARHDKRFDAGAGFAAGSLEALAEAPHWFAATTATRVTALHSTVEALVDVLEDNFEMAMDFAAVLARDVLTNMEQGGPATQLPGPPEA